MLTHPLILQGERELLTPKEVAAALQLSLLSIYRLIDRRLLPVYRVCRRLRIARRDVLTYLDRNRSDGPGPTSYGYPED